jgi:hypothetical protein
LLLAQTWYEWTMKRAVSSYQMSGVDESAAKTDVERVPESPIGFFNAVTSLAVAALTFGLPIIKAIVR